MMTSRDTPAYVIISPVRDEEAYLRYAAESIVSQTVLPREWVIVDDGSEDRTAAIAEAYARAYPWIRVLRRPLGSLPGRGPKVVAAFRGGYDCLACGDYEFLAKVDGDVSLPSTYFEDLFRAFRAQPRLGIASGTGYEDRGGRTCRIRISADCAIGAVRTYRRACYETINGLDHSWGWDGIDQLRAEMAGWRTTSFRNITFFHHRAEGLRSGRLRNYVQQGRTAYVMGYHPLFTLARAAYRMFDHPYVVAGVAVSWGYFSSWACRRERLADESLRAYLRRKQVMRLRALVLSRSGAR